MQSSFWLQILNNQKHNEGGVEGREPIGAALLSREAFADKIKIE